MKIVIATGGTQGHVYPALKVSRELKCYGHEIIFIGSFDQGSEQITKDGFHFENHHARGLNCVNLKECFQSIVSIIKAVFMSFQLLKRYNPNIVFGFGGYGAFPVVLAAVFLRYPTLIHEQNVVPGRANAILGRLVNKIAISFQQSHRYFKTNKTVLTGCPCHVLKQGLDKAEILKKFRLDENKLTILVFAGSQGSQRINEVFIETVKLLKEQINVQVIHISGKKDYHQLKQQYAQLGIPYALFEFLDEIDHAYSVADLVVARSGAVTVAEIAMFQLPAILIPYPYAQGHQKENALVLCEAKVAKLIEEKDLSTQNLKEDILETINGRFNPKEAEQHLKNIRFPDSAKRLASEALNLATPVRESSQTG